MIVFAGNSFSVSQDSLTGKRGELLYTVELDLEVQPQSRGCDDCGGSLGLSGVKKGGRRTISFHCTTQELQDMLHQLKDALHRVQNVLPQK